jgi:beta-lactam-binding protein with PASTA domain
VKAEAAEGARRDILVPALIADTRIPLEFRRIQAADLRRWNGESADTEFEKFVQSIARLAPLDRGALPHRPLASLLPPEPTFDSFGRSDDSRDHPTPVRRARRRRAGWVAAGLVMLATMAGIVWRTQRPEDAGVPNAPAVLPRQTMPDGAERQAGQIVEGPTDQAASSRQGSQRPEKSRAGNIPTAASEVEVPALVGLEFDVARTRVIRRGLTLGRVERRESAAAAPGTVLDQTPAAGSKRAAGSSVSVVLTETPLVNVPALVGLTLDGARKALAESRLLEGRVTRRLDATARLESVIGQSPVAGSKVGTMNLVNLDVAEPAATVPSLVNLSSREAGDVLKRARLTLGTVRTMPKAGATPGVVAGQSLKPGTIARIATAVDVTIVSAVVNPAPESKEPSPLPNLKPPLGNSVRLFRVVHDSPSRLDVAVEYSYDGGRGADGILIEACPRVALDLLHRICGRVRIKPGTDRVVLRTDSLPSRPDATSTHVDVCLIYAPTIYARDNQYFYCEAFPYEKKWGQ